LAKTNTSLPGHFNVFRRIAVDRGQNTLGGEVFLGGDAVNPDFRGVKPSRRRISEM
jgi:hypothetical protein